MQPARDLQLSARGKATLDRLQRANRAANDRRRETLEELGLGDTHDNRLRLRLWEELDPGNPKTMTFSIARTLTFSFAIDSRNPDWKIGETVPIVGADIGIRRQAPGGEQE